MGHALDHDRLVTRGAVRVRNALSADQLSAIEAALASVQTDTAGVRLAGHQGLEQVLGADSVPAQLASEAVGHASFPVRAVLFDKGSANNWGLGWHQDRTIVVKARVETEGFGPWSMKAGLQHVAPPFEVLEAMITMRIHLDPVDEDNAPLLVLPSSHRMGRLSEAEVRMVADQTPPSVCLADRGDIWVYSTPIVHASKPANRPSRRRVLQVDFAHQSLPGGLDWLGLQAR